MPDIFCGYKISLRFREDGDDMGSVVRMQYCSLNKPGTSYINRVIPSVAKNPEDPFPRLREGRDDNMGGLYYPSPKQTALCRSCAMMLIAFLVNVLAGC